MKTSVPAVLLLVTALAGPGLPEAHAQAPKKAPAPQTKKKPEPKPELPREATLKEFEPADLSCHLTLRDDEGKEYYLLGAFGACDGGASLVGRRVRLSYSGARKGREEAMVSEMEPVPSGGK